MNRVGSLCIPLRTVLHPRQAPHFSEEFAPSSSKQTAKGQHQHRLARIKKALLAPGSQGTPLAESLRLLEKRCRQARWKRPLLTCLLAPLTPPLLALAEFINFNAPKPLAPFAATRSYFKQLPYFLFGGRAVSGTTLKTCLPPEDLTTLMALNLVEMRKLPTLCQPEFTYFLTSLGHEVLKHCPPPLVARD